MKWVDTGHGVSPPTCKEIRRTQKAARVPKCRGRFIAPYFIKTPTGTPVLYEISGLKYEAKFATMPTVYTYI